MQRRHLFTSIASLSIAPSIPLLTSCRLMKKDIKEFGKTFEYLKDDAARAKETGNAPMVIEGASFDGTQFHGQVWRHLKFVDCDFTGGYQIRLEAMANVEFRNCHFAGVIEFGVMTDVRFHGCYSQETRTGAASEAAGTWCSKMPLHRLEQRQEPPGCNRHLRRRDLSGLRDQVVRHQCRYGPGRQGLRLRRRVLSP